MSFSPNPSNLSPSPEQEQIITPQVNTEAEFLEILNDFANPREILREGISNAIDSGATAISIDINTEKVKGVDKLVITMTDNGRGMTEETLNHDFWGLGFSQSRNIIGNIGEKGHSTKIYLKSERIEVKTQTDTTAYESICDAPFSTLTKGKLH